MGGQQVALERQVFGGGLDLGKFSDYHAFAVVERWRKAAPVGGVTVLDDPLMGPVTEVHIPAHVSEERTAKEMLWNYDLVRMDRWETGTRYTTVSEKLTKYYSRTPDRGGLGGTTLAIDHTGVGAPMCDIVAKDMRLGGARARIVPINIGAGNRATQREDGAGWNVPKKDLVSVLQVLIGAKRLKVAEDLPNCRGLVKEFDHFKFKQDVDTGHISYECLVGGTLITTAGGQKPIECVTTDDMVLTRQGFKRVLWAGETKVVDEVCTLRVGDVEVSGTPEHRVWTENRGWVELGDVTCRDHLIRIPTTAGSAPTPSSSSSTARCIGRFPHTRTTTAENQKTLYTGQYGSTSWVRSQRGITSTTSMRIPRITTSTTLSACLTQIIRRFTIREMRTLLRCVHTVNNNLSALLTDERAGKGCTESAIRTARSSAHRQQLNRGVTSALSAVLPSRAPGIMAVGLCNTAPTLAKEKANTSRGILSERAPDAVWCTNQRAGSVSIAHASVPPLITGVREPVAVYDLTVEDCHEFYANGILVENSWRERDHDDMVLALAIVLWVAEKGTRQLNIW